MGTTFYLYEEHAELLARLIGIDSERLSSLNVEFDGHVLCVNEYVRAEDGSVKTRRRCFRVTAEEITNE